MTDEEKIRDAWSRAPRWDFNKRPVMRVPAPLDVPAVMSADNADPVNDTVRVIEFRHERGMQEGRPARRVLGKLGDTEICVAFAFTQPEEN